MAAAARRLALSSAKLVAPRGAAQVPANCRLVRAIAGSVSSCSTAPRAFSTSVAAQVKKFTQDHEWIELDSDGTTGTMGISTYASKALGDVVYVELPKADDEFAAGDTIGAVESVKSASDIMAPVSGTILETNTELEDFPGKINKDPEETAWFAKMKVKDTTELEGLMEKDAYLKYVDELD